MLAAWLAGPSDLRLLTQAFQGVQAGSEAMVGMATYS